MTATIAGYQVRGGWIDKYANLITALALLAIGTWRKSAVIRWQGLTLLGVVIVKVFVFDLSFLEKFYRIVSFSLLGLALLLISFYYQRQLIGRSGGNKP